MPAEDYMSDEYVAGLLKKDAKDSTIKYSALGLQALLPRRPTTNAPKPNTRFLKNIIKETDSHNAALRAKEKEESRLRLRQLRKQGTNYRGNRETDDGRVRLHRSETIEREKKRRKVDNLPDEDERKEASTNQQSSHREEKQNHGRWGSPGRSHGNVETDNYERRSQRSSRHHHRRTRRGRDRSRSPDSAFLSRHLDHKRRHSHLASNSDDKERSEHHSRQKRRSSATSSSASRSQPNPRHSELNLDARSRDTTDSRHRSKSPKSDSDPLEAIIGPPPPPPQPKVRARGRGTFASTSAMDSHFSATYDPSVDVHPNSDSEDDWDQALEALRDRQRWKQQGAERLRTAGFTEDEVQKWEKGGEKRESDVQWAKKGEGREWDRGKIMDDDGAIDLKPEWGRLKGT